MVVDFTSLSGRKFTKFSKSRRLIIPFYDNIVEPVIQSGLIVETWGTARDANCTASANYNIQSNLNIDFKHDDWAWV